MMLVAVCRLLLLALAVDGKHLKRTRVPLQVSHEQNATRHLLTDRAAVLKPDGYADTDAKHPRSSPPKGDPVGDAENWGASAVWREVTSMGEMPEHFSLLTSVLGPCDKKSCTKWTSTCTLNLVVSAFLMVWLFKNLKVMSDVYFVPSTLKLAERLDMKPDVAGATLLAFGSSAPEFCTNMVATFFIVNECGVGDIIGSAIHNVLLIVGVSGLFAGRALSLWWYPLSRDCLFYLLSIIELTVFLWDEHIVMWEAAAMCCTYGGYCLWMAYNQSLYYKICTFLRCKATVPEEPEGDDEDEEESMFYYDPIEVLWRLTMPSWRTSCWKCFFVALLHISWLSYLMVDAAARFGVVMGIPTLFMGLVFLAAGTSIPDAFASMAAARKGEADMSVSNALGSNIFDILMGLGGPWLLAIAMGKPIVFVGVNRLMYWVSLLIAVLAVFMFIVVTTGWKLNSKMGVSLVTMYFGYVMWALLKSYSLVP